MNIDFKNVGKHYAARSHEKMQEVLMDAQGVGPAIHYYMIRGGKDQKNITKNGRLKAIECFGPNRAITLSAGYSNRASPVNITK